MAVNNKNKIKGNIYEIIWTKLYKLGSYKELGLPEAELFLDPDPEDMHWVPGYRIDSETPCI